mgnify:CR=1 FL=1
MMCNIFGNAVLDHGKGYSGSVQPLDALDISLVAALQHSPRASLNTLSDVLTISPSTVSRRLSRLIDDALIRVTASVSWSIRGSGHPSVLWVQVAPAQIRDAASALAELPEAQSVYIVTGEANIRCLLHPRADGDISELVLDVIPQIPGVERISSHGILASSSRSADWTVPGILSDGQIDLLGGRWDAAGSGEQEGQLRRTELGVVDQLVANGRITAVQIADELDITRVTAARALETMLSSGLVRPRIDVEPGLLGYPVEVFAQISCAPSAVADLVAVLGQHPNVRTASMTAGAVAVAVQANVANETALYEFVTEDLGKLEGISDVRLSTKLETVKRNWSSVRPDGRQVPAAAPPLLAGSPGAGG